MKRATFSVLTLIVVAGLTGCANHRHLPASCVGGNCTATPGGCCPTAQQGGCNPAQPNCQACDDPSGDCGDPAKKHCCPLLGRLCRPCKEKCEQPVVDAGPPAGAITYPYYTVRGPRDYFAKSPTPIGP
jgi:hypothetical protein